MLEPAHTLRALEQGWPLYHKYFVHHWSRSLRRKQRQWPGTYKFEELLRTKSLRLMTDALVRECTDFADIACYLDGYSITGARLQTLSVPARILIADDDPMIPASDQVRLAPTPCLTRYAYRLRRALRISLGPAGPRVQRSVCHRAICAALGRLGNQIGEQPIASGKLLVGVRGVAVQRGVLPARADLGRGESRHAARAGLGVDDLHRQLD